jgi:DNA polymerase-3 subunit beta
MKITTSRESLLKVLQAISGVVERRQTMPVLANVLVVAKNGQLTITATDLEVELVAETGIEKVDVPGEITVPGRKLLDDVVKAAREMNVAGDHTCDQGRSAANQDNLRFDTMLGKDALLLRQP